MTNNPWKKLDSKLIYENPWISLREDKVITPGGDEGIYGVVTTRLAVGVLAVNNQDEIYLVGQYRYPLDEYSWEIIEGGSEEGETGIETAKRELKEEAGLEAASWQRLGGELHLSNCFTDERAALFIATDLTIGEAEPDPTEKLEIKKMPFSEAVQMVADGKITDALSVMGLLLMERKRR